jgi:DNA-binding NtrC family response regulator
LPWRGELSSSQADEKDAIFVTRPEQANSANSVLIVDDDPAIRKLVSAALTSRGFHATAVENGARALEEAESFEYAAALVDLHMPGLSGMETIQEIKNIRPDTNVLIVTGNPSLETTLAAIDEHIFAYLVKPVDVGILARSVQRAAEQYVLVKRNKELIHQLEVERNALRERILADRKALERQIAASPEFVGEGAAMMLVRRQIAEVSLSNMTVLIRGGSGTGKEVVARLIMKLAGYHNEKNNVKINCAAIPETLLESELFGHEAGAFSGAIRRKPGRFELAPSGCIFLDEIGELPVSLQAKLLQVIEHKQFTRLGDTKTIRVNSRILAATNAPIEKMIEEGKFRADLFYRLNEYSISLPSLHERVEDIPSLVYHFIRKHGNESQRTAGLTISPEIMSRLMQYSWPGNVRQLETVVRRFCLTSKEESFLSFLGQEVSDSPHLEMSLPAPAASFTPSQMLRDNEIESIRQALTLTGWNRREAAGVLGISYSTLRRKIETHDIRKA